MVLAVSEMISWEEPTLRRAHDDSSPISAGLTFKGKAEGPGVNPYRRA